MKNSLSNRALQILADESTTDSCLAALAALAVDVSGALNCDILLRQNGNLMLRASVLQPEMVGRIQLSEAKGMCGAALHQNKTLVIPDLAKVPDLNVGISGIDESGYRSAIVVPLRSGTDIAGILLLRRDRVWKPTAGELSTCDEVATVIAQAARAVKATGRGGSVEAASQVAATLASAPYLEEILQLLVNLTAQQFNYKVCTVRLLDEHNQELVLRATQATMKAYQRKRAIQFGESIAGRVIVERRTMTVPDVQMEPDYIGHDLAVEQGLRSMICVPLTIQDRAVGVLTCYTDTKRDFDEQEVAALELISKQAAIAIEHAKLQVRHTLMQEMHHRVKNNLQQVVSLLRLQLRNKDYKSPEQVINDLLSRILAIASVHDLLSREDLDHVGLRSIAESLVAHTQQSFMPIDRKIRFEVRGHEIRLNMNQATQVALVLNELIQNAVEHGFKNTAEGEVHINVENLEDEVGLWVSDNGDGLAPDFSSTINSNLGLQLVSRLAASLGGVFAMQNRLGWTVGEIKFPRTTSE